MAFKYNVKGIGIFQDRKDYTQRSSNAIEDEIHFYLSDKVSVKALSHYNV